MFRLTFLYYVFFIRFIVNSGHCAKILGAVFTPAYSHQSAFWPLWKELSLRGHEVVVLTTDPMKNASLVNLTEIDLSKSYEVMKNHETTDLLSKQRGGFFSLLDRYVDALSATMIYQLEHPEVQNLINSDRHFDLLLVEVTFPTHMAFAEKFKVPFIGIASLDAQTRIHSSMGNPTHPVLYPDIALPFSSNLNFKQRVISSLFHLFMSWYSTYKMYPKEDLTVHKYFGASVPSLLEIQEKMDMLFISVNPIFHNIRALGPNTIQIGGGTHIKEAKVLPEDIKKFLDESKEGVIYFSLGTNVKSNSINNATRDNIMQALSEIPYKVLWKFEGDHLENLPKNVAIRKWLPQQDILRHPNIKLFITQCGLQSMEEAIQNHIPMIGIPFYADQFSNAIILENKGLGLKLKHTDLQKDDLKNAIIKVITNSKYKSNVKELAALTADVELTGLERAVWWTEYVIRHKGAKHLRNPAATLPLYQYFLLDVIGFLLLIISLTIFIFYKIIKFIWRLVFRKKKRKTE